MSVLLLRGYNDADKFAANIIIILKYYEQLLRRPRFRKARTSSDRDLRETNSLGGKNDDGSPDGKAIGEGAGKAIVAGHWDDIHGDEELLSGSFTLSSCSSPLVKTVVPAQCRKPVAPSSLHSRTCAIAAG